MYDEGTDYTSSIHGSAPEGTHSRRAKRSWLGRLRDRKRKAAEAEMRLLNEDLANLPYRSGLCTALCRCSCFNASAAAIWRHGL